MTAPAKRRLGRGLDGLLPGAPPEARPDKGLFEIPIEEMHASPAQPRTYFDEGALEELALSIREHGVLEPILARRRTEGGFEIIAGERRWRAAQRAGIRRVPVYVRDMEDGTALEAALVENLQREDLGPVETARALRRLLDEHGHSQESLARKLGKDRSTLANSLRLLKLPDAVLELLSEGKLSEGHGRAILAADGTEAMQVLARQVVRDNLSVRETERRAKARRGPKPQPTAPKKSANVRDLERRLSHAVGSTVLVEDKRGAGHLQIAYGSYDELDRIVAQLCRS